MTIELPPQIESAIKTQAEARGVSMDEYVRELLERDLSAGPAAEEALPAFENGYGMWDKYGVSLSAEDIDANRAEMFGNFGAGF